MWRDSDPANANKTPQDFVEAMKNGPKGDKGDPGLSAKDQWLKDNPGKTQDDYIASLKGKDGKDGKDGKSAYEVWRDSNPANAGKTEKDFIDSIGSGGKGGKDTEAPTIYITKDDKGNVYNVYRDGNKYYTTVNGKTVEVKEANVSVAVNNVVDKNGKIIPTTLTNVADGKAPNDAVNVSQLDRATQRLGREISDVREESRGIGALSASLAALHPMQYSKERPNQVMAGVGTYKNKQAVAVGVSHHFTENLMATAGVSLSGEHNTRTMANVGITWRIGKGDTEEVRNENVAIENAELKANIEKLNDKIELLERQIKLLIENSAK